MNRATEKWMLRCAMCVCDMWQVSWLMIVVCRDAQVSDVLWWWFVAADCARYVGDAGEWRKRDREQNKIGTSMKSLRKMRLWETKTKNMMKNWLVLHTFHFSRIAHRMHMNVCVCMNNGKQNTIKMMKNMRYAGLEKDKSYDDASKKMMRLKSNSEKNESKTINYLGTYVGKESEQIGKKKLQQLIFLRSALSPASRSDLWGFCSGCRWCWAWHGLLTDILALVVLYHLGQFQVAGNYSDLRMVVESGEKKQKRKRDNAVN